MSILDDVALDDHGFTRDPYPWTVDIAEAIAESLGHEGLDYPPVIVIEHRTGALYGQSSQIRRSRTECSPGVARLARKRCHV